MEQKEYKRMTTDSIISTYQRISSLLGRYPVKSIPTYTSDEERCVLGASPRIMDAIKAFGDKKSVESWVGDVIGYICKASDISKNVDEQKAMTIQMIITRHGTMKMSELMLFAAKFVMGDYEKFYGSFDMQALTRSLSKFTEFRNNIISKYDKKERNYNHINGHENRKIYLDKLMKAAMGDEKAYEFLRIESDEDMAKCVAWCVKRNEFPREMLDRLNPVYYDVVEHIINGEINFSA